MKKKDFLEWLNLGNEIEFTFNDQLYFLEPDYEGTENSGIIMYKLYLCNKNCSDILVIGGIDAVFNYKFDGNNSLSNCCEFLKDYCVL